MKPRTSLALRPVSVLLVLLLLPLEACVPSLEEQKARLRNGEIYLQVLTSKAFLEIWGPPTYEHRELMQFFQVQNGNYVPRFRVPLGEAPEGWESAVVSEPAYFLGYADRGVYRERMSAEQVHEVGKQWKREALFKTRLETGRPTPLKP
ncbi:MAG: hypothetical protein C4294_14385 [Nitrospiraceae bacterium]